jgi:DNA repair protein SbcC/Rad50
MKFHRLELEAFGVFKDRHEVNFDKLNEASLFLIRGNNGAGKTTILDAICFALYGDVPGNRGDSRTKRIDGEQTSSLKSDYADDTVKPFVELEFSVAGERYKVRREPVWKKANKQEEEKPKASLHRWDKGSWGDPLSSKVAEVNMTLYGWKKSKSNDQREPGVLGLDIEQFSMIVMLPQGKFSEFLKASSETRATLLGAIFPVQTYEEIIRELGDQATAVKNKITEVDREILASYNQLLGALGESSEEIPTDFILWLTDLKNSYEPQLIQANSIASEKQKAFDAANDIFNQVKAIEANSQESKAFRDALDRAKSDKVDLEANLAEGGLAGVNPTNSKHKTELETKLTNINSTLSAYEKKLELESNLALLKADLILMNESLAENKGSVKEVRSDISALKKAAQGAAELVGITAKLQAEISELEKIKAHLKDIENAETLVTDEKTKLEMLEDNFNKAKTALKMITELRDKSISALLAEQLVDGSPCGVCGSTTHPSHAKFEGDIPSQDDLEEAQSAFDSAQKLASKQDGVFKAAEGNVVLLFKQLQTNFKMSDKSAAKSALEKLAIIKEALETTEDKLASALAAQESLPKLEKELEDLQLETSVISANLQEQKTSMSQLEIEISSLKVADTTEDKLQELRTEASGLEAKILLLTDMESQWAEVQKAIIAAEANVKTIKVLVGDSKLTLEEANLNFEAAQEELASAKTNVSEVEKKLKAIALTNKSLPALVQSKEALSAELEERKFVSDVANGQAGRKVNIINFYLGQRLKQIAELASVRLMKMSNNHFMLEHSESARDGNKKIGLELNSFDTWSGARRPVGDLGGGELFMASLSLALALSDVVKSESGSTVSLDTLFIDEGFGALDPTFSDTVVTALEDLRTYGRTVGLVSHVESIQERIPTQLVIEKTLNGSKILPIRMG